ncbi:hypothetical protein [Campylobacter jejuni]|uniref:hypothetical protein n=1 Tax=Campylobacter jejuni TaxID=197 RepID=UPI00092F8E81|nr:hypothetical protein [Campylobacter jejuni]ECL3645986.1 hypothetical protein [Campylobacter jejuni]ECL9468100.1 hypothetical protein [Campylobacter jejuni]EDP6651506.1 hypothetical protein [Campylobacter jejuni]MCW1356453.1 hypothetical protein [Campylobacter jejuni]MCW1368154.1 hypothetical protein [Campylobacter jejuni]
MVKEIDYDLLIAIEESDVRKFQIALEKGANINGIVSEEYKKYGDFESSCGFTFLAVAAQKALYETINAHHDKKGFNKEEYEKEYSDAFEIFNTLKALKPNENQEGCTSAKICIEGIAETREMELYDDPYCYGYDEFDEEMSEDEWISEDPAIEYLKSFKFK